MYQYGDWYTLKTTGSGASFQNSIVKRLYRTLANMVQTMVSGEILSSGYWIHSIQRAVYIKNRLTHNALNGNMVPFQVYTICRPDLIRIRVLLSYVIVNQPRIRKKSLTLLTPIHVFSLISLHLTTLSGLKTAPQVK